MKRARPEPAPTPTTKRARRTDVDFIVSQETLVSTSKKFQTFQLEAAQKEFLALPPYGLHYFDGEITPLARRKENRRECTGCEDLRLNFSDLFEALCRTVGTVYAYLYDSWLGTYSFHPLVIKGFFDSPDGDEGDEGDEADEKEPYESEFFQDELCQWLWWAALFDQEDDKVSLAIEYGPIGPTDLEWAYGTTLGTVLGCPRTRSLCAATVVMMMILEKTESPIDPAAIRFLLDHGANPILMLAGIEEDTAFALVAKNYLFHRRQPAHRAAAAEAMAALRDAVMLLPGDLGDSATDRAAEMAAEKSDTGRVADVIGDLCQ